MKLEGDGAERPDLIKHPYKFLMQPGHIGKVLTRNRIYKSAAGMMM
jgi:hypothetical protein